MCPPQTTEPEPASLATLEKLAAQAQDEQKSPTHSPSQRKKSQPRGDTNADLGEFQLEKYLDHFGVVYTVKSQGTRTVYQLSQCLFDPSHGKNEASIIQAETGLLYYQCFHDTCNHTWHDAKKMISGEEPLAPFFTNYDPDWRPPQTRRKKKSPPSHEPIAPKKTFLLVADNAKPKFRAPLMADYVEAHLKPILFEGKAYTDYFYKYNPKGVWEYYPEDAIRQFIRNELAEYANPSWISNALQLFKDQSFRFPQQYEFDPIWINLKNGMLNIETLELVPHSPDFYSRAQLQVSYDEQAKCSLWIESLAQIFGDDMKKADVLQEFFGYCLYPAILFPCAIFQIGGGGNGKGTVEEILYTMLGEENVCHISLARMEKDFGPIEMRNKLLNSCSETETKPLEVSNFKKICVGDMIQAEVKFKSDVKFRPIAKHMISMNDFPGIKDRSDAFYRRILVMEYNQKFEERIGGNADLFLKSKLKKELDGIFMWALEGWKRVKTNKGIFQPESIQRAKERFKMKQNNVLLFVSEECHFSEKAEIKPPDLYEAYTKWVAEAKLQAFGKQNFYEQIKINFPDVERKRRKGDTAEKFFGIGVTGYI